MRILELYGNCKKDACIHKQVSTVMTEVQCTLYKFCVIRLHVSILKFVCMR